MNTSILPFALASWQVGVGAVILLGLVVLVLVISAFFMTF